jgi:hypothetical protein
MQKQLMPPRHPLTRREQAEVAALFRRRPRFAVVPAYFCISFTRAEPLVTIEYDLKLVHAWLHLAGARVPTTA